MVIEIAVTAIIIGGAVYLFYKSMKKKTSGCCDCEGSSGSCSKCKKG
jgi:hypothetical protein